MKLVVFSREFPEYCFRYANAMARHCEVLLVLDRANCKNLFDLTHRKTRPGLTIHFLEYATPIGTVVSTWKTIRVISSFKPDFIHFQEIPDRVAPLFALMFKGFSKIIWTIHDPAEHSGRDARLALDKRILRGAARRIANVLVAHGMTCGREIRANKHLADRVIVSEHGVLMVPDRVSPPGDSGTILFFGRMEEYKGLDILVGAAEILDQRGLTYTMIIAGEGPELARHKHRLARSANVRVIDGFITAELALDLFQNADVVVLPYKDATQSGVVAAAFGNHRPVVASRVGGLPDVVEHGVNGLLVEPNDCTALADTLQEVLANPNLLARLHRGVKATAEGKLNWDNIASVMVRNLDTQHVRSHQLA
jgi:glycosyltransferase involved in cell wall biosynthesis